MQLGGVLVQSIAKKVRASPRKYGRQLITEGLDEEFRKYFMEIDGFTGKRGKITQFVALDDIPFEVRRREAKKALYLTRYE